MFYTYLIIIKFTFLQCPGQYSFRTKKLTQFVKYHQSHPINSPFLRILNCTRSTTFYPIIIPCMVSSLGYTLLYRRTSYSASTCHPHAIGSNPPSSSFLPLAAWRSRRASLYRCTRRKIATWVVTDIIWKRCSLQTTFLNKDPPSIPPTMLAANWSMSSLPSFPRRPKRSTARVTKFMAALVEGHLSYTSVVIALSHLSSVGS